MQSFEKRQRAQRAAAVVGVDAGKFQHALVVRPRGGRDSRAFTFSTSRAGFDDAVQFILRAAQKLVSDVQPGQVLVGIEFAGSYGFTFAHYLHHQGFQVVNVLPSDTKKWKEVTHHQTLKTDAKDALGITDLASQGHFVTFAFLEPAYAELRYLVSARERLSLLRRGTITRLKSALELVLPEFERLFAQIQKPTPLAILEAFPGPAALLAAPKRRVLKVLKTASRGHLGEGTYQELIGAARATLALPLAQGAAARELPLMVEQLRLYNRQLKAVEDAMKDVLTQLPEAEYLLTIPGVAPVTAATFLGSVGDVRAYESSRQILRLAGLSLTEASSGTHKGRERISKRGRPVLRRHAYIFALRCVQKGGLFRTEFDAMVQRNGGVKIKALATLSRQVLKIMYTVARERRAFVPVHEPPARWTHAQRGCLLAGHVRLRGGAAPAIRVRRGDERLPTAFELRLERATYRPNECVLLAQAKSNVRRPGRLSRKTVDPQHNWKIVPRKLRSTHHALNGEFACAAHIDAVDVTSELNLRDLLQIVALRAGRRIAADGNGCIEPEH